ncbi:sensor histidine kinase [Micromonospora saelicesensis]|uniref:histidine kinase n=1 Tax=Micromonospora saelicesensis TaxID=285676 RepID=A0A1C4U1B9_9ACTN|nr:histidine kinase [Micromonospora saelicesensis]RAN99824.1 Histidine kinase [Micromonospora saelicesensis]SCE65397.1 Signal transduction histidine kinase [Micromonospora saelicesensis]
MTSLAVPEHPWLLPGALVGAVSPDAATRRPRRTTRDWAVDTLAFLLSLLWVLFVTADALSPDPAMAAPLPHDWMTGVDALLGLVCCGLLWLRRRWPLGLIVATTPLTLFSMAAAIPLLIFYFTVVVHRRTAVAIAVTGAGLLTNLVFSWVRPDPHMSYWETASWGVVLSFAVLAWGMFVRARRQLIVSLRERAERAEAEQQLRVTQARHLERTRIAREMHDVLAHRISLLSLHAGALEFRPDAPADEVARAAGVIRGSAHAALQDLREVIGVLRAEDDGAGDAPEPPQPTLADLPALIAESRSAGVRVNVSDSVTSPGEVPAALGRAAYRIVQEGLTNARKHAAGAAVTVDVAGGPGAGLSVAIGNRWPVGAPAGDTLPGAGTGLVGISERVTLAGGRLAYGRDDSGDFRLAAWLPWPA